MRGACVILLMLACLSVAGAATLAPRPLGLILLSPDPGPTPAWARLADLLTDTLMTSRQWEPTVLTAESPLVRLTGLTWPAYAAAEWPAHAAEIGRLAAELRLAAVLVIIVKPGAESVIEVLWGEAEVPGAKSLTLRTPGQGDAAYLALARQLVTRLGEGFTAAPAVTLPPAAGPAPTPPASGPASPPAAVTGPVAIAPGSPATAVPGATAPAGDPSPSVTTEPPAPGSELRPPTPAAGTAAPEPPKSEPSPATPAPAATPVTGPAPAAPAGPAVTDTPVAAGRPEAPAVTRPEAPIAAPAPAPQAPTAAPAPQPVTPQGDPARTIVEPDKVTPSPATGPAPAREPSVYLVSAEKYLREGDYTKALDWGDKALTAGDDKASVYYLYARIEAARQNRLAERRWLERTLEVAPGNGPARLRLAELLRDAGLWHKAIEEYQTVLKMEPGNLHAYLGLSAIYAQHAQPRRAAELIAEALTHHPEDVSLYMRLGDLHTQRGAPVEAEAAYDRAARLAQGEDRALALDRLGDLYLGAGRHHEAFICFAEASKLRVGGTSPVAEKRYQHVMGAADEALQKALTQADRALQSYLAGGDTTREEAYQSLTDANTQVQEARELAELMVAPESLRLEHARRKLAYTLARETLTLGLVYLDTSRAEALADYRLRLEETRRSFRDLVRTRG